MAQRLSLGAKSQQRWEAMFRSSQPQLIKSRASSPEWGKLLTCLKAGMITVLKFYFFHLFLKVDYGKSKNKHLKLNKAINCCGGGAKIFVHKHKNRILSSKVWEEEQTPSAVTIFKIMHFLECLIKDNEYITIMLSIQLIGPTFRFLFFLAHSKTHSDQFGWRFCFFNP